MLKQKAFWSTVFKEHVEALYGIVRLIIVRVTPFRRPLGIFSPTTFVSAIEVVSALRSMVYITGRSRVYIPFYVPCNHVRRKDRCGNRSLFWSAVFKEHFETLHGIVRLIIVRVAPFRRPLGIFSSTTFIVSAKQNVVWLSLNLPEAYFT